jgi:hypothetical protein
MTGVAWAACFCSFTFVVIILKHAQIARLNVYQEFCVSPSGFHGPTDFWRLRLTYQMAANNVASDNETVRLLLSVGIAVKSLPDGGERLVDARIVADEFELPGHRVDSDKMSD